MIETSTERTDGAAIGPNPKPDFMASWAFMMMHLAAIAAFFTGFSWVAIGALAVTFWVRLFAITGGYHRYFSHRSYSTSRAFQFVLAWLGAGAGQNGPIWWVSHHRHHHQHADTEEDVHPPGLRGFWWAHAGWILSRKYSGYDMSVVRDLRGFPEIRFIDRNHMLAPLSLGIALYALGAYLGATRPELGTSGIQLVAWGLFLSTVLLYHTTFLVNSVTHLKGSRRFDTDDDSRNNWVVALLTLGEGWHNNHHRWASSERQGFYWWEIDVTHYVLTVLSWLGIVWDLKTPPESVYAEARGRGSSLS